MITGDDLAWMVNQTRDLRRGFAATAPTAWDPTTAGAELAVQLGHLANCIARRQGVDVSAFDDPQRPISHLGDELADVALATLSVATLADAPPTVPQPQLNRVPASEVEAFLLLVIVAGRAAEAAMIATGHRHQPTGRVPEVAQSCATTVGIVDALADTARMPLVECFRAMVTDASRFLGEQPDSATRLDGTQP